MKPVIRHQSQLLFRQSYKPTRNSRLILRRKPDGLSGLREENRFKPG